MAMDGLYLAEFAIRFTQNNNIEFVAFIDDMVPSLSVGTYVYVKGVPFFIDRIFYDCEYRKFKIEGTVEITPNSATDHVVELEQNNWRVRYFGGKKQDT